MTNVSRTRQAQDDIDSIADYIFRRNRSAALGWLEDLKGQQDLLATFPEIGSARDDLAPELRSLPFGNYVIYFRVLPVGVVIARVLHGARNHVLLYRQDPW